MSPVISKRESDTANGERTRTRNSFLPAVDIIETEQSIVLLADLPGVDESNVDITIERNTLTLRAQPAEQLPEGFSQVATEYRVGDFERVFTLSNEVNRDGVEATVRNGVLKMVLPKAKHVLSTKVAVKAG